jgi:hypothetical protein
MLMVKKVLILLLAVLGAIGSLYGASSYTQAIISNNVKLSIVSSENGLISLPANISAGLVMKDRSVEVPVQIKNRMGTPITGIDVIYKDDIQGVNISISSISWASSMKGVINLEVAATNYSVADEQKKSSTLTFLVRWKGGEARINSKIGVAVTKG